MNPGHALYVSIPSPRQIRMTRTFDAPRHLVFDAFTQPELIRRWIGRPGDEMTEPPARLVSEESFDEHG